MYRILTNIGGTVLINVGKYVIDGAYGIGFDMMDYVGDGWNMRTIDNMFASKT